MKVLYIFLLLQKFYTKIINTPIINNIQLTNFHHIVLFNSEVCVRSDPPNVCSDTLKLLRNTELEIGGGVILL